MDLIVKEINYRLIQEKNNVKVLCKNGYKIMQSTHNEGKPRVRKRFIKTFTKTLKGKIYKK